jgi:glucokinase
VIINGAGLSSCGVIDPHSGVVVSAAPNVPGWEGTALTDHVRAQIKLPAVADNDANCALVGEAWKGAAAFVHPTDVTLMFTLGTGLGGAMMVGDKLITGRHSVTGHFGLAKIWEPIQGHYVSTEWLTSGTGLSNIFGLIVNDSSKTNGEAVMELAKAGGANATKALNIWLNYFAQLIENYYWMLDPASIIIGGGVIHSHPVWWPGLQSRLALRKVPTTLLQAKLGNDAGMIGAAKLFFDRVG